MATVYSANYQTGTYTYTRVKIDYSGTSATATLLYSRTNDYSGSTSTAYPATFTFGGQSVDISNKTFYGRQTDATVGSVSFTISSSGGTYSGYTNNAGLLGFSGSVDIPAQSNAPTGLSGSDLVAYSDGFSATVSISSWGTGATSSRYKDFEIWGYTTSTLTDPSKLQRKGGTNLSDNIVLRVDSTIDPQNCLGDLNIVANTRYTLALRCSNGAATTGNIIWRDAVTLAYKPQIVFESATKNAATFTANLRADGGFYKKKLYYSLDGTNWTLAGTFDSGSAASTQFIVYNLTAQTQYTLHTKVSTIAGDSYGEDFVFNTSAQVPSLYGSNSVQRADEAGKLYASVNGQATNIKKVYGSVNGVAQVVFDRTISRTGS